MLQRAMQELTGKADLVEAVKIFVHPQDKVCVKVNGIAQQNMTTNKELVLPFVEAMVAAGVPGTNITLLEQYPGFFQATRIRPKDVPAGVAISWHSNNDATMDWRDIPGGAPRQVRRASSPSRRPSSTSRSSRTTRSAASPARSRT